MEFETILERAIQFTEDLRFATQAAAVEFCRDLEPGLRFRGRALAMERVLVNLLVNGARAASASGGTGQIRIRAFTAGDDFCIIVNDSGAGIEPHILPRIFEPGFSTRSQSSGLGLHIVRTIIEEHGGTVTAANRQDTTGACFTIRIPAKGSEGIHIAALTEAVTVGAAGPQT